MKPFPASKRNRKDRSELKPAQSVCSVCKEGEAKYKCPTCRSSYCSVSCCRQHKASFCNSKSADQTPRVVQSKYVSVPESELRIPTKRRKTPHTDDTEESWKVTSEMKMRLIGNKWLKQELQDSGLRHLIGQVYEASNVLPRKRRRISEIPETDQERVLAALADKYTKFSSFLNKIRLLSGVANADRTGDLDDWLLNDVNQPALSLVSASCVPSSKKQKTIAMDLPSESESSGTSSDEDSVDSSID